MLETERTLPYSKVCYHILDSNALGLRCKRNNVLRKKKYIYRKIYIYITKLNIINKSYTTKTRDFHSNNSHVLRQSTSFLVAKRSRKFRPHRWSGLVTNDPSQGLYFRVVLDLGNLLLAVYRLFVLT